MTADKGIAATMQPERHDTEKMPPVLSLELTISDPEIIRGLWEYPEGGTRNEAAMRALRIGILALQQAQGQIDAGVLRQEGERLIQSIEQALRAHDQRLNERMTMQLKEYFDPESGRFHERVERLIKSDGDIEQVLRRAIGSEDSELCKTLVNHVGDQSPLMKLLDPGDANGLTAQLRQMVDDKLREQRERVLREFSLDTEDGALRRFLCEIKEHYQGISGDLNEKIDKAIGEFSLDDESSALSRLVARVTLAQETITKEFSLDEERSALNKLRKELVTLLENQSKSNQEFQQEVIATFRELKARKEEAARSTTHGHDFEEAVFLFLDRLASQAGDVAERTGNTAGRIKFDKKGDIVIHLGPESAAAGARIVIEAKEAGNYTLKKALDEMEVALKNRDAQIGIFVFSRSNAPEHLEPIARFGNQIVVVWDAEDSTTDIYLKVAVTLARALCVREQSQTASSAELADIEKATLAIEKQAQHLDEIRKSAGTIKNAAEKILKRQQTVRDAIEREVEILRDRSEAIRNAFSEHD